MEIIRLEVPIFITLNQNENPDTIGYICDSVLINKEGIQCKCARTLFHIDELEEKSKQYIIKKLEQHGFSY